MSKTKRRMPFPSEANLGTRVHKDERKDMVDKVAAVVTCDECGHPSTEDDLDDRGRCPSCSEPLLKFEPAEDEEYDDGCGCPGCCPGD